MAAPRRGRHPASHFALLACLVAASLSPLPAIAQDAESLTELEEAAETSRAEAERLAAEAAALRTEIQEIRQRSIDTAARAQSLEQKMSGTEERLEELRVQEAEKQARLVERRAQLRGTLMALQRIALRPPEAMVAQQQAPVDTVRSAMLLSVALPQIELRAAQLEDELRELTALREEIDREHQALQVANQALLAERAELDTLLERKQRLTRQVLTRSKKAEERAAVLADKASNLRELMTAIEREARQRRGEGVARVTRNQAGLIARLKQQAEAEAAAQDTGQTAESDLPDSSLDAGDDRQARATETAASETQTAALPSPQGDARISRPANIRPFPESGAVLVPPVSGRVVTRFGEVPPGSNVSARGVTIRTRESAQVVAPYDAQVAYAGIFRGYGQILILEHAGGYHTLLAGLSRIDAVAGQWVLAGEPIGRMGTGQNGQKQLYVELRQSGKPINPLPWLANLNDKVRG